MARDEAGAADEIRRVNRTRTEAQMRNGLRAGLVRVIDEVTLRVIVGVLADDLHAVLVRADGAVRPESVEHGARHVVRLDVERRIVVEAQVRDVVLDADAETVARMFAQQLVEYGLRHRRREVLARNPVASADHERQARALAAAERGRERRDHVLVQRLAGSARLLRLFEHRDAPDRRRQRREQMRSRKRPVQTHLQHAGLAALRVERLDRFLHRLRAGAHQHDHFLRIGRTLVFDEPVAAARQVGETVHQRLDDAGHRVVVRIHRLARLEVGIGVVRGAAHEWPLRAQRAGTVRADQPVVDHRVQHVVVEQFQRVQFVRRAKAVEEMQERYARLQRRGLRDQRAVVRLLDRRRAEERKARHPRGHDVRMVTEDRQRRRRERARRHMKHRRGQLARDLVHVREHQHQPLRRGERRRQRARLQRAVHRARRAALGLHLLHGRQVAPQVRHAFGHPLVGQLRHHRRRRDREDRAHFVEPVGDLRDRRVSIHRAAGHRVASVVGFASGAMSIAWHGQVSKQTAQPVQRSRFTS